MIQGIRQATEGCIFEDITRKDKPSPMGIGNVETQAAEQIMHTPSWVGAHDPPCPDAIALVPIGQATITLGQGTGNGRGKGKRTINGKGGP